MQVGPIDASRKKGVRNSASLGSRRAQVHNLGLD